MSEAAHSNEWLEHMRRVVPDYGGYADQATRREQDARYRQYVSDRLQELLPLLEQLIGERARTGHVIEALPLERVRERVRALLCALGAPDYGATAFFNARPVDETVLDLLYQYDLVLAEQVRAVRAQLEELRAHPPSDFLQAAERVEATLLALEAEFKSRCDVIRRWA
jgi:hypothetical protein